ncbi:helix-turn-helix domain-containing protein [Marivirga sp.]|uniref:helix-turn-helix domain-containing protein n=1 Tax=Marivirga sp. TaxID=2018662 RepID=UPI0025ECCC97|nr:helix-turn-helix domain-containing protein [Marivirga sp.]
MSENLKTNLNLLMKEAHLNAEELSRRIGLPASTIKKIRNNDDPNPTLSTLTPLAKYFSLTISQLVGDEPFSESRISGSYNINLHTLNHVPLISWEEAINWPFKDNKVRPTITTEYEYSKDAYALIVDEDDWESLSKDTVLLVDPKLQVEHRDFIIAHRSGQKTPTLKQVLFDEGQMYLKPVTQKYNIAIFTSEHKILGVIVEYKKQLRKNPLELID